MNTIEQNKDTVTASITALFSKGDLGAVDDCLAEDFVNHDPPLGVTADREGMRGVGAMFHSAFPDWQSDMEFLVVHRVGFDGYFKHPRNLRTHDLSPLCALLPG